VKEQGVVKKIENAIFPYFFSLSLETAPHGMAYRCVYISHFLPGAKKMRFGCVALDDGTVQYGTAHCSTLGWAWGCELVRKSLGQMAMEGCVKARVLGVSFLFPGLCDGSGHVRVKSDDGIGTEYLCAPRHVFEPVLFLPSGDRDVIIRSNGNDLPLASPTVHPVLLTRGRRLKLGGAGL